MWTRIDFRAYIVEIKILAEILSNKQQRCASPYSSCQQKFTPSCAQAGLNESDILNIQNCKTAQSDSLRCLPRATDMYTQNQVEGERVESTDMKCPEGMNYMSLLKKAYICNSRIWYYNYKLRFFAKFVVISAMES